MIRDISYLKHIFFAEVQNLYICTPYKKEEFNKLKIKLIQKIKVYKLKNQKTSTFGQPEGIIDRARTEIYVCMTKIEKNIQFRQKCC